MSKLSPNLRHFWVLRQIDNGYVSVESDGKLGLALALEVVEELLVAVGD